MTLLFKTSSNIHVLRPVIKRSRLRENYKVTVKDHVTVCPLKRDVGTPPHHWKPLEETELNPEEQR